MPYTNTGHDNEQQKMIYIAICLSACLPACLPACLSVYLSIYLSICLSVCLSVYLSIYLYIVVLIHFYLLTVLLLHLITTNDTHTHTHTHTGRVPLDEGSGRRRDLYPTTHNTHKKQISIPLERFEPEIPASERPQTHDLDRAATGIGHRFGRVPIQDFAQQTK